MKRVPGQWYVSWTAGDTTEQHEYDLYSVARSELAAHLSWCADDLPTGDAYWAARESLERSPSHSRWSGDVTGIVFTLEQHPPLTQAEKAGVFRQRGASA